MTALCWFFLQRSTSGKCVLGTIEETWTDQTTASSEAPSGAPRWNSQAASSSRSQTSARKPCRNSPHNSSRTRLMADNFRQLGTCCPSRHPTSRNSCGRFPRGWVSGLEHCVNGQRTHMDVLTSTSPKCAGLWSYLVKAAKGVISQHAARFTSKEGQYRKWVG